MVSANSPWTHSWRRLGACGWLQAVPRLRHTQDPGVTEENEDASALRLEGRLQALGVWIIHTVGTPLPLGTGPGLRPAGWEADGPRGGCWRRRSGVHALGSCGRSSPGQVPRGQTRPGGCKPQAKVEKGRSLPTNPFYTVKTAGLSPKKQLFNLEAHGGKKKKKINMRAHFLSSFPYRREHPRSPRPHTTLFSKKLSFW